MDDRWKVDADGQLHRRDGTVWRPVPAAEAAYVIQVDIEEAAYAEREACAQVIASLRSERDRAAELMRAWESEAEKTLATLIEVRSERDKLREALRYLIECVEYDVEDAAGVNALASARAALDRETPSSS